MKLSMCLLPVLVLLLVHDSLAILELDFLDPLKVFRKQDNGNSKNELRSTQPLSQMPEESEDKQIGVGNIGGGTGYGNEGDINPGIGGHNTGPIGSNNRGDSGRSMVSNGIGGGNVHLTGAMIGTNSATNLGKST
ncbi:hypothetical protein KPH14_003783 [Odynerus spinipes]|uniref:Uncharacterized protein n=1 Tax=Odynerus spinipes TaxID=1348599 RepID=A0AAD9RXZ5_9HYME|nr:hypothetical protein KPH14_003783 [Odynerus spinipes]